jgi:hypothetical protein
MASSTSITVVAVALLVLAAAQPARACYTRVFSFGDSLADTGNYGFVFPNDTGMNALWPPYGETYFGNATGRFSNGRLVIDFIGTTRLALPLSTKLARSLILKSVWVRQRTRWACRSCRRTGAGRGRAPSTSRSGPTSPSVAPPR